MKLFAGFLGSIAAQTQACFQFYSSHQLYKSVKSKVDGLIGGFLKVGGSDSPISDRLV